MFWILAIGIIYLLLISQKNVNKSFENEKPFENKDIKVNDIITLPAGTSIYNNNKNLIGFITNSFSVKVSEIDNNWIGFDIEGKLPKLGR